MNSIAAIRNRRRNRSGFTLIEMLVVVLIIGILLAVAIPAYLSSVKTANIRAIKANMKIIATAAQAYKTAKGAYPADDAALIGLKDIAALPTGPSAVTYTYAYSTTGADIHAKIPAADAAQIVGDATVTDVTYDIDTATYAGDGTPPLFQ